MGGEGPRRLALQSSQDFWAELGKYLNAFSSDAAIAIKKNWIDKGDVEKQVMEVSRTAELTQEMIVEKSDPAMAGLDALLTITPKQLTEALPALQQQRQRLLDTADVRLRAVELVPENLHKSLAMAGALPTAEAVEQLLAENEELAAMMATPMVKADRDVLTANFSVGRKLDPKEAHGILLMNMIRVRLGIGALLIDPRLCAAARGHSQDMKEKNFFAHTSPVPGKEDPWKRAQLAGTTASGENIFMGSEAPMTQSPAGGTAPAITRTCLAKDITASASDGTACTGRRCSGID